MISIKNFNNFAHSFFLATILKSNLTLSQCDTTFSPGNCQITVKTGAAGTNAAITAFVQTYDGQNATFPWSFLTATQTYNGFQANSNQIYNIPLNSSCYATIEEIQLTSDDASDDWDLQEIVWPTSRYMGLMCLFSPSWILQ